MFGRLRLGSAWLFDLGAPVYDAMNAQRAWLGSCARLAAHFPADPAPRVLDLGCGPAFAAIALAHQQPDARLLGLDLAPRMLRLARRRVAAARLSHRIGLVRADAARLPFASNSIDVVSGHSFLYLVDEPRAVLAESLRVLRPGGRLVLMEPSQRNPGLAAVLRYCRDPRFLFSVALWRPYSRRHGRFSPRSLTATLVAAGFVEAETELVLAGLGIVAWAQKPPPNAADSTAQLPPGG